MKIFILEDDLTRIGLMVEALGGTDGDRHTITIARDLMEVPVVFEPPYDVMFLDHDLGGRQLVDPKEVNTGTGFVLRYCPEGEEATATHIFVHTFNPDGAKAMIRILLDRQYSVNRTPFGLSLLNAMTKL